MDGWIDIKKLIKWFPHRFLYNCSLPPLPLPAIINCAFDCQVIRIIMFACCGLVKKWKPLPRKLPLSNKIFDHKAILEFNKKAHYFYFSACTRMQQWSLYSYLSLSFRVSSLISHLWAEKGCKNTVASGRLLTAAFATIIFFVQHRRPLL